ncbi:amidohydrolase family protein [Actinomyces weissii]|uniref:Amidohydrolase family protein n=1 Tax=Actinomyces weissii TaxID=675090 RepID=A0A7T7M9D0_9ACTO|nr:amidohydrolase family protein [Actinomyces weissii]QQM66812.1 amidohydrolase family protein [Actinomyces weissii]
MSVEPGQAPLTRRAGEGYTIPGGLVDVHCHIGLGPGGAVNRPTALAQARAAARAGIGLIRDCGAPTDTHWLEDPGQVAAAELGASGADAVGWDRGAGGADAVGWDRGTGGADAVGWDRGKGAGCAPPLPRIIRAGRHLARPKRYLLGFAEELASPDQLPEAVARQAACGDGWVKIVADWIDRSQGVDADIAPLWPAPVLAEAVAAAHEAGARVTAHTFSRAALGPLIEAGVDCLEHATGAGPDEIAEIAARGIAVTPTFLQVDRFPSFAAQAGGRYPRYAATVTSLHAAHEAQVAAMHDAGVRLLPGSDAGGSLPHDCLPAELLAWRRAGLADVEILRLATTGAREFLAVPGVEAGPVTYLRDPAEDLTALLEPVL